MWHLSISPSTQKTATLSRKFWLKPQQTLNNCRKNTETLLEYISGIFLLCWISFSASSHSLTRQSKNPEQSQGFQFPPEKWFCFMRDVTSTPVWLTNNFKYSAPYCTALRTVLFLQIIKKLSMLFLLVFCNQYCTSNLIVVLRCFVSVWRQTANGGTNWKYWFHCFGSIGSLLIR